MTDDKLNDLYVVQRPSARTSRRKDEFTWYDRTSDTFVKPSLWLLVNPNIACPVQYEQSAANLRPLSLHSEEIQMPPLDPDETQCHLTMGLHMCGSDDTRHQEDFVSSSAHYTTAPDGWKNTIRHNLCFNSSFRKTCNQLCRDGKRKSCFWHLTQDGQRRLKNEICTLTGEAFKQLEKSMSNPGLVVSLGESQSGQLVDSSESKRSTPALPKKAPNCGHHLQVRKNTFEIKVHCFQFQHTDIICAVLHRPLSLNCPALASVVMVSQQARATTNKDTTCLESPVSPDTAVTP
ncbi:uncharacterized protein V6R79_024747 [Siganus canaliculatus]